MDKKPVFIVADRQALHADLLRENFKDKLEVVWTDSAESAYEQIQMREPAGVICDLNLGCGDDGLGLLEELKNRRLGIPVIVTSSTPSIEACKHAIRRGAYDFLVKPVQQEELFKLIEEILPPVLRQTEDEDFVFHGIRSRSPAMRSVYRILRRVAPTDLSVLIEGESGTGKELTARAIHENSRRRQGPFYPLNCAGLTESLLESELFGHVKGAFTGAVSDRKGLFQLSDNGTLFLDEIGDMPLAMQAKLLRVLEDGIVRPVGSATSIVVDVRVISATNHDLAALVEEKKFRQDLYFRIKEAGVTLPPLRQRPQDIPELFGYFLQEACRETGRDIHLITEPAMRALMSYSWPGNIRQLRNVIRTMVVLCEKDTLNLQDLPVEISRLKRLEAGVSQPQFEPIYLEDMVGKPLEEVEKEHIRRTLEMTGNNRAEAARILKIGERTLYRKIKEYNL